MLTKNPIKTQTKPYHARAALYGVSLPIKDDHLVGAFAGDARGPTLIVIGSLHGNEPAGFAALSNLVAPLKSLKEKLKGRVYFLCGNTRALTDGVRFLDADLNRHCTPYNMSHIGSDELPAAAESLELTELDRIIDGILITANDEVYVLDLHSTSAGGRPFATVGDTLRNRNFALRFPVTILLGVEENLDGTMLEYLNNAGAVTFGFEGGQHTSKKTVSNHEALVWLALANTGILNAADITGLDTYRAMLANQRTAAGIVEVRHRHPVGPADQFEMKPGFNNFDPVKKGDIVATDKNGPVRAVETGLILMPLYQKLGEDGFFIGRRVSRSWLAISEVLRRSGAQRLLCWLPGVRRDRDDPQSLIVNTRVARIYPLEIFHLFGYRRRRRHRHLLTVTRRKHDTQSPFKRGTN